MRRILVLAGLLAMTATALFGVAPPASATAAPSPGGLPIIRDHDAGPTNEALPVISINWSGYAATSRSKFTYASTQFIQPTIKCTGAKDLITSNWVGLDGFTNETVEQDGTFAYCGGKSDMTPVYKAWYEMYPAGSVVVFGVKPGDSMTATVSFNAGKFALTISDGTSGKSYRNTAPCASCQRASAEWIIERAAFCVNKTCSKAVIGALPNFGTTAMTDNVARAGTTEKGVTGFQHYAIEGDYNLNDTETVGPKGFISVDTVSPVTAQSNSFTATFDRSGQPCPINL